MLTRGALVVWERIVGPARAGGGRDRSLDRPQGGGAPGVGGYQDDRAECCHRHSPERTRCSVPSRSRRGRRARDKRRTAGKVYVSSDGRRTGER